MSEKDDDLLKMPQQEDPFPEMGAPVPGVVPNEFLDSIPDGWEAHEMTEEELQAEKDAEAQREADWKARYGEPITEEMDLQDQWYKDAKDVTLENLDNFIRDHLLKNHDYGTVCHAIIASLLATFSACNKLETAGVTGFQASMIALKFVGELLHIEGPFSIVTYEDMLFPQYGERFDKVLSKDVWDYLQKMAAFNLREIPHADPAVKAHWESIVNGNIPFGYKLAN